MVVDANVCSACIKVGRLDTRDGAPWRQILDVFRDVGPVSAAVFGIPNQTIVGAGPDKAFLDFRGRDGEDDFAIKLAEIVANNAARRAEVFWILRGKIGADNGPTLPAVAGFEDDLAAVVDSVVVEGIDGQRRSPVAAISQVAGRRIERMNPRADGTRAFGLGVPPSDLVTIAACPNNIRIGWIGKSETRFASAHATLPTGFHDAAVFERRRDAGPAHVGAVLHVGVDVVRNLVVHSDVIHLADRKLHAQEAAAVNGGDVQAAVVGDDETVGILRIDPNVVIVAAPGDFFEKFAAIERFEKTAVGDVDFVVVAGGHGDANVISRAADELALVIDGLPVFAGVVGAPERSLVFCLNECEVSVGVSGRDGHIDFAERRFGQAVAFELGPFRAAVFGNVNRAAGPTAELTVSVHFDLPHPGEQNTWIV